MPAIIDKNSQPREYWVKYLSPGGVIQRANGGRAVWAVDAELFGARGMKIQILDYGVALWGKDRNDSRTVIPWSRVLEIEEVF